MVNVLRINCDDMSTDLPQYMPFTQELIYSRGVQFRMFVKDKPVCGPDRTASWTMVTSQHVGVPENGDEAWAVLEADDWFERTWMALLWDDGYRTYAAGKQPNGYTTASGTPYGHDGFVGSGPAHDEVNWSVWRDWDGVGAVVTKNSDNHLDYQVDYIRDDFLAFLDDWKANHAGQPLAANITPHVPHDSGAENDPAGDKYPARWDHKPWAGLPDDWPNGDHENGYCGGPGDGGCLAILSPSDSESYNRAIEDINGDPGGLAYMPTSGLSGSQQANYTEFRRDRVRCMQAVDDLIDSIIAWIVVEDDLANWVIIFDSDNGFHLGEHRLRQGKSTGFKHDVVVPLVIVPPDGDAPIVVDRPVATVDVGVTILELAGVTPPTDVDGISLVDFLDGGTPAAPARTCYSSFRKADWNQSSQVGTGQSAAWDAVYGEADDGNDYAVIKHTTGDGDEVDAGVGGVLNTELYLASDPDQLVNRYPEVPAPIRAEINDVILAHTTAAQGAATRAARLLTLPALEFGEVEAPVLERDDTLEGPADTNVPNAEALGLTTITGTPHYVEGGWHHATCVQYDEDEEGELAAPLGTDEPLYHEAGFYIEQFSDAQCRIFVIRSSEVVVELQTRGTGRLYVAGSNDTSALSVGFYEGQWFGLRVIMDRDLGTVRFRLYDQDWLFREELAVEIGAAVNVQSYREGSMTGGTGTSVRWAEARSSTVAFFDLGEDQAYRPVYTIDGMDLPGVVLLDGSDEGEVPSREVDNIAGTYGLEVPDGFDPAVTIGPSYLVARRKIDGLDSSGGQSVFALHEHVTAFTHLADRRGTFELGERPVAGAAIRWVTRARVLPSVRPQRVGPYARTVDHPMQLVDGCWKSAEPVTWSGFQFFSRPDEDPFNIPPLFGSSAPIRGALIQIRGPMGPLHAVDPVTGNEATWAVGSSVEVEDDEHWLLIDTQNWIARIHDEATWDTSLGDDVSYLLDQKHSEEDWLVLTPQVYNSDSYQRRVFLVAWGNGRTSDTWLKVRAHVTRRTRRG